MAPVVLSAVCRSTLQDTSKYGSKRKHEELNDELVALIKVKGRGRVDFFLHVGPFSTALAVACCFVSFGREHVYSFAPFF